MWRIRHSKKLRESESEIIKTPSKIRYGFDNIAELEPGAFLEPRKYLTSYDSNLATAKSCEKPSNHRRKRSPICKLPDDTPTEFWHKNRQRQAKTRREAKPANQTQRSSTQKAQRSLTPRMRGLTRASSSDCVRFLHTSFLSPRFLYPLATLRAKTRYAKKNARKKKPNKIPQIELSPAVSPTPSPCRLSSTVENDYNVGCVRRKGRVLRSLEPGRILASIWRLPSLPCGGQKSDCYTERGYVMRWFRK